MHSQWSHNGVMKKVTYIEFTYSNLYFAYKRIIVCVQVLLIFRIKANVLMGSCKHSVLTTEEQAESEKSVFTSPKI